MALLIAAIILKLMGFAPFHIYLELFRNVFGDWYGLSEVLVKFIPLSLASLGVSIVFRMKMWNIGAEGQFYMGAVFTAGIAVSLGFLPREILLPVLVIAGAIGGAFWAIIAVIPKVLFGVNEIITTLLFNYVAILGTNYLIYGPWKDPAAFNFPLTPDFPLAACLPTIGNTRLHLGIILALAFPLVVQLLMQRSKWGYEVRVIGDNRNTAMYAGMSINKNIIITFAISGALAGIAGMTEVSGVLHHLQPGFSPGYGYTAIIVAWLARLNPWGIVLVSFLLGGLLSGSYTLQAQGLASATVFMLQGLILFSVLIADFFAQYTVKIKK